MNISLPAYAVAHPEKDFAHLRYRLDIDGLRAIAIIPVVLFHAFPDLLPGGFIGVDIFFVISGFLITSIIARELEQGSFSIVSFYSRRVRRIFPALALMLSFTIAVGWFLLLEGEFREMMWHVFAGGTFWQNIALYQESGYFDRASEMKPLLHLWSLAIEEQFYIFLPLALFALHRKPARMGYALSAAAILSFVFGVSAVSGSPEKAFYMPHLRAWELLAGSVLALSIMRGWSIPTGRAGNFASLVGGCAIAASVVFVDKGQQFPGWIALAPVAGAVAIIASGKDAWLNRVLLSSKLMVFIGLISFPLYLWHWPMLVYLRLAYGGEPPASHQIFAIAISTVLAYLTYRLIERPIRERTRHKETTVMVLASAMTALAVIGAAGSLNLLDRFRPSAMTSNSQNFSWDGTFENDNCRKMFPALDAKFCNLAEARPPTVALIGDSHALVYFAGLATALVEAGDNLLNLGSPSCMPAYAAPFHSTGIPFKEGNKCRKAIDQGLSLVEQSSSVHTIILSGRRFIRDMTDSETAAASQAMGETVRRLAEAGKNVFFILDFPEPYIDPSTCVRSINLIDEANKCFIDIVRARKERQTQEDLVRSVLRQYQRSKVVDSFDALCEDGVCPIVLNGQSLYLDRDHLSRDGSAQVAKWLSPLLIDAR